MYVSSPPFSMDPYAEFHACIIFRHAGISGFADIAINCLSGTFPRVTECNYTRFTFKSFVYIISGVSLCGLLRSPCRGPTRAIVSTRTVRLIHVYYFNIANLRLCNTGNLSSHNALFRRE